MVKKYFSLILMVFTFSSFAQGEKTVFDIARTGTVEQITSLFKQNPKIVNATNDTGYSPLILACYRGNIEVAKFLIKNGADVNANSSMGSPLMAAVVKGNIEVVNLLLEKRADVNVTDANGITALIYAVQFRNAEIVKILIDHKADKTHVDKEGKTAFEYAVFTGNESIINLLK